MTYIFLGDSSWVMDPSRPLVYMNMWVCIVSDIRNT